MLAGVGEDRLLDPVAPLSVGTGQPERGDPLLEPGDLVPGVPLLFREERAAVGDDHPQVAGAGQIDAWIVDLVDDAVTQREPDLAHEVERRPDPALGAGGPARRDPGPAGGGLWIGFGLDLGLGLGHRRPCPLTGGSGRAPTPD